MGFGALESLNDPLVDPILALLKDAVNADLLALTSAVPADDTRAAILTTQRRPLELALDGEGVLPALACYRIRSKASQFTLVHVDHIETLQFAYATPSVDAGLLDERWAVLDWVWRRALRTLKRGKHPAHASGADVLSPVGVIRVNIATAIKREAFVALGGLTFPGFVAEIEVTWRPIDEQDQGPYFPALSFDHRIYVDAEDASGTPDVVGRTVLPAGEPPGRDFPTPDDWSL